MGVRKVAPLLDFRLRCISESTFSQQLPAAVSAAESSAAAADECTVASFQKCRFSVKHGGPVSSTKYKSIRLFFENVKEIHEKLEELSLTLTSKHRERAHELNCAMNNSSFIVSLVIIAKYSADLEPVTQSLQAVNMDKYLHSQRTCFKNND